MMYDYAMATKGQRHETIASLVRERSVFSQEELREQLGRAGINVTQATLSRDLQQLGALKGPSGFVLPGAPSLPDATRGVTPSMAETTLRRALLRELRAIDAAGHLAVIRTDVGHANALAVEIDRVRLPEILGTVAGDDTILLVARRAAAAKQLVKKLKRLAS